MPRRSPRGSRRDCRSSLELSGWPLVPTLSYVALHRNDGFATESNGTPLPKVRAKSQGARNSIKTHCSLEVCNPEALKPESTQCCEYSSKLSRNPCSLCMPNTLTLTAKTPNHGPFPTARVSIHSSTSSRTSPKLSFEYIN